MKKDYDKTWTYIGIAVAGTYGSIETENSSCSITTYDDRLTPHLGNLREGGTVVDKRPCVKHEEFYHWVIKGPMLRQTLPACSKHSFLTTGPTPCSDARTCMGFDFISEDLYLSLWRSLGARIGKRVSNTIQWEDGEVFNIPPFDSRNENAS